MTRYIDWNEVSIKLDMPSGLSVVLLDRLAKEAVYGAMECARNLFLVDATGKVIWQVESDFDADGDPFTNVFYEANDVQGYRWDGCIYKIEVETGKAVPVLLAK